MSRCFIFNLLHSARKRAEKNIARRWSTSGFFVAQDFLPTYDLDETANERKRSRCERRGTPYRVTTSFPRQIVINVAIPQQGHPSWEAEESPDGPESWSYCRCFIVKTAETISLWLRQGLRFAQRSPGNATQRLRRDAAVASRKTHRREDARFPSFLPSCPRIMPID